jgi:rare lipoprotein A
MPSPIPKPPIISGILLLMILLTGCSSKPRIEDGLSHKIPPPADLNSIPDAVPKPEPLSRYGNPHSYQVLGQSYSTLNSAKGYRERGIASWYGSKFHGRRTSSGEPYDMYAMTAAHKSLPLPTYARVTNLRNNRSVVVKINDRGPFHDNRLIDLSYTAAWKLDITGAGTGLVEVTAIDPTIPKPSVKPEGPKLVKKGLPEIFLQVGAFGNANNAQQLKKRLETELQTPVQIETLNRPQQAVYRVRVGPIASVELCDFYSQKLARLGLEESHLVIQ